MRFAVDVNALQNPYPQDASRQWAVSRNPRQTVSFGREDLELLRGAIDTHVHAAPDVAPRIMDEMETALEAKKMGMRGLIFKSGYTVNAGRMLYVNKAVPEVKSIGGVVLNPPVGGLNPYAVETTIKLGGRIVWMPTIFSEEHFRYLRRKDALLPYVTMAKKTKMPEKGLTIVDGDDGILPEVEEILGLIADANVILATGHLSPKEIRLLVDEAFKRNVKKIVITHPQNAIPNLSLEEQVELAEKGAYLEHCFLETSPMWRNASIEDIAASIEKATPERCVLATDFGQIHHPPPPEGLRMFIRSLLEVGVGYEDIEKMVKHNPAKLLDLD